MAKKRLTVVRGASAEFIERKIYLIRGERVMLDSDLAEFFQVPTKRLNEAVKRNLRRFPKDFMFHLKSHETEELNRSQIATGSQKHRDPRLLPYVFTEHGVAMLSAVLKSRPAIEMSILIVRTFVRLRDYVVAHKDLAHKMEDFERTQKEHGADIQELFGCIDRMLEPAPEPPKRRIGFAVPGERDFTSFAT
jgi:hypothetical protein